MENLEKDRKTENKLPTSSRFISDNQWKYFGVFTFSLFPTIIPIWLREVGLLAQGQTLEPTSSGSSVQGLNHCAMLPVGKPYNVRVGVFQ